MAERIWFLTELYYPERTSTGFIITRIAESLAEEHRVGVICAQPTYAGRGRRAPKHEVRHGVTIIRCRSTTFERSSLVLRAINMLTITLSVFIRALAELQRNDLVIVGTNPPLLALAGALACRFRHARLIHLVHDVYPDAAIAAGVVRDRSWIAGSVRRANRWVYRIAETIVTIGRDMQELVRSRLPEGQVAKVVVIPNWSETEELPAESRIESSVERELGLQDRFILEYYGNMGRTHAIEDLLMVAGMLDDSSKAHFLFAGSGVKAGLVRILASQSERITLVDEPPWERQADYLRAADLALVALQRGMLGVSVPSRMYALMAAGRPILAIAEANSEVDRLIREEEIGWTVPPGGIEELERIIRRAEGRPEELRDMGRRARAAAKRRYSPEIVLRAWHQLVEERMPAEDGSAEA